MGYASNGTKPIAVLHNEHARTDIARWAVCCTLCRPLLFFGGDDTGPAGLANIIASAPTQERAVEWAQRHADDHEARRCGACGHMPAGAVNTPLDAR